MFRNLGAATEGGLEALSSPRRPSPHCCGFGSSGFRPKLNLRQPPDPELSSGDRARPSDTGWGGKPKGAPGGRTPASSRHPPPHQLRSGQREEPLGQLVQGLRTQRPGPSTAKLSVWSASHQTRLDTWGALPDPQDS